LSSNTFVEIVEVSKRLALSIENDLAQLRNGRITAWSATQAAYALVGYPRNNIASADVFTFVRENRIPSCSCWSELPRQDQKEAWTFISGWVLATLAGYGVAATPSELSFLLDSQNEDGSWSSVPERGLTKYAPSYSTGWILIGLQEQLNEGLIASEQDKTAVDSSIKRAVAWLLSARREGARWRPYPNLMSSSDSASISGLVLHALHGSAPDLLVQLDIEWLDNLPDDAVPASLGENSYVEIARSGGIQIDHFVQLTVPWMMIATIDAFDSGTLMQRVKALSWLEKTMNQESVRNADAEQSNWWRAELLHSITYLVTRAQRPRL